MSRNANAVKRIAPSVPFDAWLEDELKNPAFKRAYDELGPEFEIVSQIIALRQKRKMSQRDLAARMDTPQPSIARMESTKRVNDLAFVRRVADALDARLEVRLVPKEAKTKRTAKQDSVRTRGKKLA